jgi:hypothetical protein
MEWSKKQYNEQYEKWVPWLEDLYLRYFTKDNKASYATRGNPIRRSGPSTRLTIPPDTLNKSKVTGIEGVDKLQDGVNNLVTGQVGQGGLGQPIGDLASREGVNRGERMGKDDKGGYIPQAAGPVATGGNAVIGGVAQTGQQAAGAAKGGLQSVGGALGFGGQKK